MNEDTLFRCAVCGREVHAILTECLRDGYPVCHNQPMKLVETSANIPASFEQAIKPITNRVVEALRAPADPRLT